MANTLTSTLDISNVESFVQRIVVSLDTAGTFAVAMTGPTVAGGDSFTPDEYWAVATSQGTDVVTLDLAFDLPNNEVDISIIVENAGTIGTWEYTVFLKWYGQGVGGGIS